MQNNNKKIINKLSVKLIQKNTRSFIMILSVIIIFFMLYTIFSVGFSYYDNYKIMNTRIQGTNANVSFTNPTVEQLDKIKDLNYISTYGIQTYCGQIIDQNLKDSTIVMTSYSNNEWINNIKPTISDFKGKYPKEKNEIAMSKWTLDKLKLNAKIGSNITLSYMVNDVKYNKEFTLTGIFKDFLLGTNNSTKSANVAAEILYNRSNGINYNQYGNIIVSQEFTTENEQAGSKIVMLTLKDKNFDSKKINDLIKEDLSISSTQNLMTFGLNNQSDNGIEFIIASLLISLFIILSGYFLISNIMRISVIKDIHYYGQLKTLGATKKQLSSLVKKQVMIYGLLGIPVGIILSVCFSIYLVPNIINLVISGSSIQGLLPVNTSFNLLIFILSIIFVFFTLFISCTKSTRIVNKITPIEGIKFNILANFKNNNKKHKIKSKTGCKIYKMAFRNVFEDKKKAMSVYLSLFIGLLAFLTTNSVFAHPDYSIRFRKSQPYTFNIKNNTGSKSENISEISEKDIEVINQLKGIKNIIAVQGINVFLKPDPDVFNKNLQDKLQFYDKDTKYYLENPEEYCATIIILKENQINKFIKYNNNYDKNKFEDGNGVIGLSNTISPNKIGKKIEITNGETNKKNSFELVNLFSQSTEYLKDAENYYLPENDNIILFVSEKGMERISNDYKTFELKISSDRFYDNEINEKLIDMFDLNKVTIKSQMETENSLSPMIEGLKIGGNCFSFILILIGILNFINVIITNMEIRKKPIAILQAIGLSRKQLCKMLIYESLYYVGISIVLLATIGVSITKILVNIIHQSMYYFKFIYPINTLIILSIMLIIICITISLLLYKNIIKQSISNNIKLNTD